jgi:hypothetical protein
MNARKKQYGSDSNKVEAGKSQTRESLKQREDGK